MFKHEPIELGYDLVAETTPNGRMYKTPDGKSYPSITTMLGYFSKAAIMAWRKELVQKKQIVYLVALQVKVPESITLQKIT